MPATQPEASARERAFVEAWVATQGNQQFESYAKLYAPGFRGVRRTASGSKEMSRDEWLKDRKRMFKPGLHVEIRDLRVHEAGTADGVTVVEFEQRFAQGDYRDKGPKEMRVRPASPGGDFLIEYEELKSSEPWLPDEVDKAAMYLVGRISHATHKTAVELIGGLIDSSAGVKVTIEVIGRPQEHRTDRDASEIATNFFGRSTPATCSVKGASRATCQVSEGGEFITYRFEKRNDQLILEAIDFTVEAGGVDEAEGQ